MVEADVIDALGLPMNCAHNEGIRSTRRWELPGMPCGTLLANGANWTPDPYAGSAGPGNVVA
jgi:hypothetical protein